MEWDDMKSGNGPNFAELILFERKFFMESQSPRKERNKWTGVAKHV